MELTLVCDCFLLLLKKAVFCFKSCSRLIDPPFCQSKTQIRDGQMYT